MRAPMAANPNSPLDLEDVRLSAPALPELPSWLSALYPFRTRLMELNGERMSMVDEGSGPPVLLLHGNPSWSFEFRQVIPRLAITHRVIAPDLVGFGLSSKPRTVADHSIERHAEDLAALAEALNLRDLVLVLHGWAGPIGTLFAQQHPGRVSRMVYAGAWAFAPGPEATIPFGVRLALSGGWGRALDRWLRLTITSPLKSASDVAIPDLVIEAYKHPFAHGESRAAVRCFWRMLANPDESTRRTLGHIEEQLAGMKMPVDIVWGSDDHLLSDVPAFRLRELLPKASEPRFIDRAGHFIAEDAPDALVDAILRK